MSTWARFHRWTPGRRTARTRRSPSQGNSMETGEKNCKAQKKKKHPPALAWVASTQKSKDLSQAKQARRATKQRTWVKQNKTQRKKKKKRTQKAHMKKSNEQQQSDLRDRGDQKYAHPQDRHQPFKTTSVNWRCKQYIVHITSTWLGCYPPVPSHRIQVSKGPMPQPMQVAQTTWEEHCEEKNRRQRGYRHK